MDDRTYAQKLREWETEWFHQLPWHVAETFRSMARTRRPLTAENLLRGIASNDATYLVTQAAKDLAHRLGY